MRLSAYNFKFANAGALNTAPVLQLTKDGVSLKIKKSVLDYIQSDKVAPSKTYDLGFTGEIKAVLISDSLEYFAESIGGDFISGYEDYIELTQEQRELNLMDVEFLVKKLGVDETFTITNLVIVGAMDAKFKVANAWYIPLIFKVTATTQLTIIEDS